MGMGMGGILSRAEDESVVWLFQPPNHLSFPGSFQEVIYIYIYNIY
jgi:hypothetical protein